VRNVVTDMRQKAGQKCTAARRILVPTELLEPVQAALVAELARIVVGDPEAPGVHMGPVATASQLRDVRAGINLLSEECDVVLGGADPLDGVGAEAGEGFFVRPTLLRLRDATIADKVHAYEVFGPCATLVPYDGGAEEAAAVVARGQGCLVSSVYADDRTWLSEFLMAAAPWNGRIVAINEKVADQALPPGMVLPGQVHGGPGRAGGGEELGGLRGLDFYTNRVAIQGDLGALRKILGSK
jgi:3,4-dehydroadipyl-CoA semialdehyde dehydrogenase